MHGRKFRRDGGMDADSSRLRPHSKALIHRIRKFPFGTNGSRRDTICRFRPDVTKPPAVPLLFVENSALQNNEGYLE